MSAGMMLLTILAVLIFCGLIQRVLDRMHLTDRQALLLVGLMLLGTLLPNLTFGPVSIGLGGALIPLGVCAYLFIKADEPIERWRSLIGAVITGTAVYAMSALLPAEAEALPIDPMWLCGAAGGVVAWVAGRSRRCAFICGVLGVVLADVASFLVARLQGYQATLTIGGAGVADAVVGSGVLAVLLCELVGETVERFVRRRVEGGER